MPSRRRRAASLLLATLLLTTGVTQAQAGQSPHAKARKPADEIRATEPRGCDSGVQIVSFAAAPREWLARADYHMAELAEAGACVDTCRGLLFNLVANSEDLRVLKARQDEIAATQGDVTATTRQIQMAVVEQATRERRFETLRLDARQTANLGRLGSNLVLAVASARLSLDYGRWLAKDADSVLTAAKRPDKRAELGVDFDRLAGVPTLLNQALEAAPGQIAELKALMAAVEQARLNNSVEWKRRVDNDYQPVEDF